MRTQDTLHLVSDTDRITAARLAAERLEQAINIASIRSRAHRGRRHVWDHFVDSAGGVTSERRAPRTERAGR